MNATRLVFPCFALFIAGGPLAASAADGKISVAVGTVTLVPADGGAAKPLAVGDAVPVGARVKTAAASRAVVLLTGQSAVRVAENSEVLVEALDASETAPKVLLDLKAGSIGALIKPQAESAMDFKVKTPSGVAAARGTFFSVAVEDGKGFVQVKEGKVDVTPADAKKTEPQVGKVTVAIGDVRETPPGGAERALKVGDAVQKGSTIKTGANSRAVVTMTTQSAVRIGPNSETVVQELVQSHDAPKVLLDLKSGSMGALIDHEVKGKMDFKIKTPSGVAAARGTFYSVVVEGGKGFVQTESGEVKIIPLAKFE
ncbi:MAG: FecR family protein, partial [Verrucomicrobiales bacterium]